MQHRTKEAWHTMKPYEVERRLKTNAEQGLGPKVSHARSERFGENDLFNPAPRSVKQCARRILTDPALLVLAFVSLVALCFSHFATALTVLFVLALSCTASIVAYVKTGRLKETLSSAAAPNVRVVRAGKQVTLSARLIVPGDVILLGRGDVVPCDARLIRTEQGFCVRSYVYDEENGSKYVTVRKDADEIYDAATAVHPLKRANMVYTGSVVERGAARAIVTETGERTYIAAHGGADGLAFQVGEPAYLAPMRRYMNKYSLIMCALILPVTVIGLIAGRGNINILDVLLLTLSLVVSVMSEQVLSMGRIICASSVIRARMSGPEANRATLQHYAAIDALSRVDELFVLGRSAISDGCLHPYAAYVGTTLHLGTRLEEKPVQDLYEMIYYYEACAASPEHGARFGQDTAWQKSVAELGELLSFDHASAKIRTVSLTPRDRSTAWVEVRLRQSNDRPDRFFRIHRCNEPEPLLQCNARRVGREIVNMDSAECKTLFDIFCQLRNQGTEVRAYIREEGGLAIFEGILSFREAYSPDISDMLAELEQSHVRVSLFLPEEGKCHLNYLIASGWIEAGKDAVSASKLTAAGRTLDDVFEQKRVFFGFSEDEVARQITLCRSRGHVTASLGLDELTSENKTADTCFYCEASGDPAMPMRGCEAARRQADVLIRRAGSGGGGLGGVFNAITTARSIHFRMMLAMQYLLVAQLLRMTMVILPLLFGRMMLSPALLLISGIWVDLGYILICAFNHCGLDVLRTPPDFRKFFAAPLKTRPDWVCATVVCGLFTVLMGMILSVSDAPSGRGLELYMFLSLFAAQTCLVFCLLRTTGPLSRYWRGYMSSLIVLGAVVALPLPIILIPPVATWFGAVGRSPWVLLALFAPLYLGGCYFLSILYRKKIVRICRVIYRALKRRLGFGKKRASSAYTDRKDGK